MFISHQQFYEKVIRLFFKCFIHLLVSWFTCFYFKSFLMHYKPGVIANIKTKKRQHNYISVAALLFHFGERVEIRERIECKCVISVIVDMLGCLPTSDDASPTLVTNSFLQGDTSVIIQDDQLFHVWLL